MLNNICRIVTFLILLLFLGNNFDNVFCLKNIDGIIQMKDFYMQKTNMVDVLFAGSSHIFVEANTATLWKEYGISSYVLGGSIQPLWNSYYFIKEALKTQKPKLVVIDVYRALEDNEYAKDTRTKTSNLFGMKFSLDKLDAVWKSTERRERPQYFLQYPMYHARYSDLSKADFLSDLDNTLYDPNTFKGFYILFRTKAFEKPKITTKKVTDIPPKSKEYLNKIIALTKKKDIPLLLIVVPYARITDSEEERFNMVAKIAAENNVKFIDLNRYPDIIGLDYSKDLADFDHLNYSGGVKFTRFLGNYIKQNYSLAHYS